MLPRTSQTCNVCQSLLHERLRILLSMLIQRACHRLNKIHDINVAQGSRAVHSPSLQSQSRAHACLSSGLGPLQAAARLDRSSREGVVRRGLCIPLAANWLALFASSLVSQVAKGPALGPGRSGGLDNQR
jgi:hypothetical protein